MKFNKLVKHLLNFSGVKEKQNLRVLFLENGNSHLSEDAYLFQKILINNKIECNTLCYLSELPIKVIVDYINEYDVIVFETSWHSKISKALLKNIDNFCFPETCLGLYISRAQISSIHLKIHQWINLQTDDTLNFDDWNVEILKPILTPKKEATDLMESFLYYGVDLKLAKVFAIITVNQKTKALEEYGNGTLELQNMDAYFRYYDNVLKCINDYENVLTKTL